eukprot:9862338-Lingulodinium_polyedra.AAC.1
MVAEQWRAPEVCVANPRSGLPPTPEGFAATQFRIDDLLGWQAANLVGATVGVAASPVEGGERRQSGQ